MSIHIGLNHVDPSRYNGWDGALSGCINDAQDMKAIADGLGYQSRLLTDADATSARVISEIGQAAQALSTGDILLLTYSGHGGQVADVNGDEADAMDETWVLWDRQLIDDELYSLWDQFLAGVRIFVLSDSCHSGTVVRMVATYQDILRDLSRTRDVPSPEQQAILESLSKALVSNGSAPATSAGSPERAVPAEAGAGGAAKRSRPSRSAPAGSRGSTAAATSTAAPTPAPPVPLRQIEPSSVKGMPPDVATLVNTARAGEHAAAQWIAGPSEKSTPTASVILISGCQDQQVSMDGARNGLFTEKLKQAWNDGQFTGDYRAFWSAIVSRMPANQQPNYDTTGKPNSAFEAQRPFTVDDGQDQGQDQGTTTTGHPVLRRGASGPEVETLQQMLIRAGYPLDVDGDFGPTTEDAVERFQTANGLTADGIVGPQTWDALENAHSSGQESDGQGGAGARPTIRQGATGPDVVYLQQRLQDFGFTLPTDGNFGPMTASAVRSFQSSNGLPADGIVGPGTWSALG
jgi:peptidoglycan hydrolase-like protein with peptidoglycan-binding domain